MSKFADEVVFRSDPLPFGALIVTKESKFELFLKSLLPFVAGGPDLPVVLVPMPSSGRGKNKKDFRVWEGSTQGLLPSFLNWIQ